MRFLVCHPGPAFSVADVHAGWVEALCELGQQVVEFNLDDRLTFYDAAFLNVSEGKFRKALTAEKAVELAVNGLYAALYKTRPDVLLVISAFLVPAELLDLARRYGTRVVILHTEAPYEDTRQLAIAPHADLNLLNDPVSIDRYRQVCRVEYMPHAYRPSLHCPGPADPALKCDLAFVGTGFESRIAFLEAMDLSGLDVLLGGNWQRLAEDSPLRPYVGHDIKECLDNADGVRIYRSARAGINLYRRETDDGDSAAGWAMGPREVEMAAVGLFFLRDPRGEGDEVLPMLPTFAGPDEAGELLYWWLAHDDKRAEVARQARQAVACRTFRTHAAKVLRMLDN
jgi:spore maturation protein CgeB